MADDWIEFEDEHRRFGLSYPSRWEQVSPLSKDAGFACATPDARAFVEIICLGKEKEQQENIAELFARLWAENATNSQLFQDGRVMSRRTLFSEGESCGARVVIAHKKFGVTMVTDYCIFSVAQKGIMITLQARMSDYRTFTGVFEKMVTTLSAPWMSRQVMAEEMR